MLICRMAGVTYPGVEHISIPVVSDRDYSCWQLVFDIFPLENGEVSNCSAWRLWSEILIRHASKAKSSSDTEAPEPLTILMRSSMGNFGKSSNEVAKVSSAMVLAVVRFIFQSKRHELIILVSISKSGLVGMLLRTRWLR